MLINEITFIIGKYFKAFNGGHGASKKNDVGGGGCEVTVKYKRLVFGYKCRPGGRKKRLMLIFKIYFKKSG